LAKELTGGEDGTKVERNRDGWVEVVGSWLTWPRSIILVNGWTILERNEKLG
jgi:hypothetical protein